MVGYVLSFIEDGALIIAEYIIRAEYVEPVVMTL